MAASNDSRRCLTRRVLGNTVFALIAGCVIAPLSLADVPVDDASVLQVAHQKRARAAMLKSDATRQRAEDKAACLKKILVNSCQESAQQRYLDSMKQAQALDEEGQSAERAEHQREVQARAAQRAVEEPIKEAHQLAQAQHEREKAADKAEKRAREEAENARQAEKRRRQAESDQAALRRKWAKRDADLVARQAAAHTTTSAM